MITPKFTITQDDDFIFVSIFVSNIRFQSDSVEIIVDSNLFIFHLSPYYLRLRFENELIENEKCTAIYKASDECIFVSIPKLNQGEFFPDLDLPIKLLARQGDLIGADALNTNEKNNKQLIEEIGPKSDFIKENDIINDGEKFNWEIEQTLPNLNSIISTKYGFNNQYDSMITVSVTNGNDINELDYPENTQPENRIKERLNKEKLKFDPEYYVAEYMTKKYGNEDDLEINRIKLLLKFIPSIPKEYLKWYKNSKTKDSVMPVEFNKEEHEQMQNNLPKKEYIVDNVKSLYFTILSLLFSYIFEQVENEGVHNTESAWTIGKLTPQISFLDQQILLEDVISEISMIRAIIITGIRRSLSYPLHRDYELAIKCWNYVYYLLRGGKRLIIKALLDIHEIFRFHDVYYIYNKILLDDLCAWFISNSHETIIRSLAIELKKELDLIKKSDIEFECLSGIDEEGKVQWENLTLEEMEFLSEQEYLK